MSFLNKWLSKFFPVKRGKIIYNQLNQQVIQLYHQGNYSQVIAVAEQVLELALTLWGENHPNVATSLHNLAGLYREVGRFADAEPLSLQALAMTRELLGENHPDVAASLNNLAILFAATARPREALSLMLPASKIHDEMIRNLFSSGSETVFAPSVNKY